MVRLPQVGKDTNQWGKLLNEFLSVSHNSNGTIKTAAVKSAAPTSDLGYNVRDYGATGDGTTDDAGAFTAALAAMTNGGALLIPQGTYRLGSNITIPSGVTICWFGGLLSPDAGKTVTINGGVECSPSARFFTGNGQIQFGLGSLPEIWVDWFGAKADASSLNPGQGTDSTSYIQAAIDSVPRYGGVDINFNSGAYRITSSLNIIDNSTHNNRAFLKLFGRGSTQVAEDSQSTWIVWDGDATTWQNGSIALVLHSRYCHIEGFRFVPANGKTLASGIDIDQASGSGGGICTQNRIKDCNFTSMRGLGKTGHVTDGITVMMTVGSNGEFMVFEFCTFDNIDHAGVLFASGGWQSMMHTFIGCSFTTSAYGIYSNTSSFMCISCNFTNLFTTGIRGGSISQPVSFLNCNSETCEQLMEISTNGTTVSIRDCRFAADYVTNNKEYIRITSGNLVMENTTVERASTGGRDWRNCRIHAFGAGAALTVIGGTYSIPNIFVTDTQSPIVKINANGPSQTIENAFLASSYPYFLGVSPFTVTQAFNVNTTPTQLFTINAMNANGEPPDVTYISQSSTGGSLRGGVGYNYWITFVTANGETKGSHGNSMAPDPGTNTNQLTMAVPLGPPGTIARKIYRTDWTSMGLVTTISDNTTTTFTDVGNGGTDNQKPPGTDTAGFQRIQMGNMLLHTLTLPNSQANQQNLEGYILMQLGSTVVKVPYYTS